MKTLYILIVVSFILIFGFGCQQMPKEFKFESTAVAMGTIITLKAVGVNAQVAIDESFRRIAVLEETINVDIAKIEDSAGSADFVQVSQDTYEILRTAQNYSQLTNGAFDVTIGAAVELWNIGGNDQRVSSDEEIEAVKPLVGYNHLHLRDEDHSARLDLKGVKIDLGALAKGYAVDLARQIYVDNGITDGLIDFGTSTIYAFGSKRIALKDPRQLDKLTKVITVNDSAISTSGDYIKYFIIDDRRYHHILDQRTCKPAQSGVSSVSVVIDGSDEHCAMTADILSTAVFVDPIFRVPNTEFIIIEDKEQGSKDK